MTSPIWASDMLRTAEKLAGKDAGRGRPALCDLRRATSTAYYALFHQLTRHGALAAFPAASEEEISAVARWYTHAGVRKAANWVVRSQRSDEPPRAAKEAVKLLRTATDTPPPAQLALVATSFVELHDARHDADYSHEYDPVRYTTLDHVATADAAVRATWSMWRAQWSPRTNRVQLYDVYSRLLHLALLESGGSKVR